MGCFTKKESGSINSIAVVLIMLSAVILIFITAMKTRMITAAKVNIQNALEASCYGALITDKGATYDSVKELMDNRNDAVANASLAAVPDTAYNSFKAMIENNLGSMSAYNSKNTTIDNMRLTEFIVYNVVAGTDGGNVHRDIEEYRYNASGLVSHRTHMGAANTGSVITPTGKPVTETSVYCRVDFTINIFKNNKENAYLDLTCAIRRDAHGEHSIIIS